MRITRRALNRATLARQLLLERSDLPILDAVEHLLGLQSQTAQTWYHGLWSRLADFSPHALSDLLENRALVRIALMRSTIHLVSARDALFMRPLLDPMIQRQLNVDIARTGLTRSELVKAGHEALADKPLTFSALGKRMAERWPEHDPDNLARAARAYIPLVQVPPRGLWGRSGQATHAPVDTWLGKPVEKKPNIDELVLRYLAAFGPASVKDAQTWSGLTRLAEVFDRLRPRLVTLTEDGRELFDLPDAPRPAEDTPAPPRYLYDFDNLLLSHHDRTRVVDYYPKRPANGLLPGLFLVDGVTTGYWAVKQGVLSVHPHRKLLKKEIAALTREGAALLKFAAPELTDHDVRFTPAQ